MICRRMLIIFAAAFLLTLASVPMSAQGFGDRDNHDVQHVLLISIDGMHAADYLNCVASHTCPTLAALGKTGVNYTRTTTSRPSDSFPGLMALVTGGTPKTVGAFYDVAYDRVLAPPINATGNGLPGAGLNGCTPGKPNGTQTEYEEGVEFNQALVNGGGPYSMFDGGTKSIDPTKLERDPFVPDATYRCKPVYPWNFVRTNTIYGVLHAAGFYTAWEDKHPVYASVSGPTGTSVPSNIDDYYSPEVNSDIVPIPGLITATGFNCGALTHNGNDWTTDFNTIQCNDQLKVNGIVNEINGKNHLGTSRAPVPALLGMDFQAVSVGEKLIENGVKGGYTDAAADPTPSMLSEIRYVDAAIGQMVDALQDRGLLHSTVIIITAKHGQSPIDTHRFFPIPGSSKANGRVPSDVVSAYLPAVYADPKNGLGPAEDDISQLWLTSPADTAAAVNLLETTMNTPADPDDNAVGLGQIFFGATLEAMFNPPGIPKDLDPCCKVPNPGDLDPRTPDIVVIPNVGVVYTGSTKKQSEHGGFAIDDTNVMLLVSNPGISARTDTSFVETDQVAPTILQLLGLDPQALDAVRIEGTPVLPGFGRDNH